MRIPGLVAAKTECGTMLAKPTATATDAIAESKLLIIFIFMFFFMRFMFVSSCSKASWCLLQKNTIMSIPALTPES
jgi:hypothetical protein